MYSIPIPPRANKFIMNPVIINNAFSMDECNKLLEYLKSYEKNFKYDSGNVGSLVIFPKPEIEWFINKVIRAIMQVNQIYNFDITHIGTISFLKYEKGSFMELHSDIGNSNEEEFSDAFKTRKITMSILVSDKNDYKGGKLSFFPEKDVNQEQGTIIAYPSFVPHKVDELTEGTRKVILVSINGPVFT